MRKIVHFEIVAERFSKCLERLHRIAIGKFVCCERNCLVLWGETSSLHFGCSIWIYIYVHTLTLLIWGRALVL